MPPVHPPSPSHICKPTAVHKADEVERKLLGLLAQAARRADPCVTVFQHFPLQLPALQWADQQNNPLLRCASLQSPTARVWPQGPGPFADREGLQNEPAISIGTHTCHRASSEGCMQYVQLVTTYACIALESSSVESSESLAMASQLPQSVMICMRLGGAMLPAVAWQLPYQLRARRPI